LRRDVEIFGKSVYLAGVLKGMRIDHVHAPWSDMVAFVSLIASRLLGISYSVEGRAADIHRTNNRYALREIFGNAAFVVTNSRYNESHIRAILGDEGNEKIHTIYEGIEPERFRPVERQMDSGGRTRVLTVSRLVEEKGLPYLLKACKILRDGGYVFECNIIGGPHENFMNHSMVLQKLHEELGLEDCVFFRGNQPFSNVMREFNRSDLFVLPCVIAKHGGRDISPNALIEAMAMKLPVISTRIAAIPEIVEDGVSGILVSPNDENRLAEAMARLMEDPSVRKRIGENARKRVEERFDLSRNYSKFVELFSGEIALDAPMLRR
jgi:glycosyltransferase involved in cell wall biosynthesis